MKLLIIYMGDPKDEGDIKEVRGIKHCNPNNSFSEVHVVIPNTSAFSEKRNPLIIDGNVYLYFFKRRAWLSVFVFLKTLKKAVEIIREKRIDLIRAYNPHFSGLIGIIAGKFTGVPCVISIHSDLETFFEIPGVKYLFKSKVLTEAIEKFCLKNAKLILIQAEHMRGYLSKKYKLSAEKFWPIKIMIERPRDISWAPEPGYFTIIFVGRLDEQKNPLCLIKALKLVKEEIPQARLWLVGDGKLSVSLKNFTQANEIKDINFFGKVGQDEVFKLLSQSHIFVHPGGKGEGFSNTILEAQTMGLPVLVTDRYSQIADIDGYVLTHRYGDSKDCADKIINLHRDKEFFTLYSRKSLDFIKNYINDNPLCMEEGIYTHIAKAITV